MTVAVIGGSGFRKWQGFTSARPLEVRTPYAAEPVRLQAGEVAGCEVVFLPRHGPAHTIPPHRINYRANIRALKERSVNAVLAIATVGGITPRAPAGSLMIPDQLLDYTYGREHTFFDGEDGKVAHVEMTEPYCDRLRARLIEAARQCGVAVVESGTYAATQGPRFETPAEIVRLERDGADVVGMTGMPEAALARELQLAYATLALVVNPAAGKADGGISMTTVREQLESGRSRVERLLERAVALIHDEVFEVPPPMTP